MEDQVTDFDGTKYPELQKQLLSKTKVVSIAEVLNLCRNFKASVNYMRQMGELQGKFDS